MSLEIEFKHSCIILDACCVITLSTSGQFEAILKSIPKDIAVAAYVAEEEVQRDNLIPLIEQGLIQIVEPETEAEANDTLNFAAVLKGNGEAYTGAIAVHRNWAIATDERRVLNFFAGQAPHLQLLTTPELLKFWIDTTNPNREVIQKALEDIENIGKYTINKQHRFYKWWHEFFDPEKE